MIRTALTAFIVGALLFGIIVKRLWKQKFIESQYAVIDECRNKNLFYTWLIFKKNGNSIAERIKSMGATRIAVFGLGDAGRLLVNDLADSGVSVEYAIELNNPSCVHETLDVLRLYDDKLAKVDFVLVCPPYKVNSIKHKLCSLIDAKVISLESLISNGGKYD
jgi:hypothetical protein